MKEFLIKTWTAFRAWKYSNIALWTVGGAAVVAAAIVIVLCAANPNNPETPTVPGNNSSVESGNNNAGATNNGSSNNGGSTDNNGSSSDNTTTTPKPEDNADNSADNPATDSTGALSFYKTSSHAASLTVSPGKTVAYSVVVTNNGTSNQTVTITDEIPAVAEYVSGCNSVSGNQMKWEFTLGAKESKTVTYTLKAKDDEANLGKALDGTAKVNGTAVAFHKIYVERTFGSEDQRIMETAIDAFRQYTAMEGTQLLKMIYYVACSRSVSYNDINGNPLTPVAMLKNVYGGGSASGDTSGTGEEIGSAAVNFRNTVIPTLYGGKGVTAAQMNGLKGEMAAKVTASALMAGDILLVQESEADTVGKLYIYNGQRLFLLANGVIDVNTDQVLNSLPNTYRYAGLRVCMVMTNRISFKDELTDTFTDAQKAVIATAEALVLRGDRGQYDATSLMKPDTVYEYGENSPEDYTSDSWKYSNCANLTYDAFYFGLGYDSGANWYTSKIITTAKSQGIYYYEMTGNESADIQKEMREKFFQTLQPGDVICIRRANNTGHALLYIGNGKIIHSTGGSYTVASSTQAAGKEAYEATFRYLNAETFFEEKCDSGTDYTYYLFGGKVTKIGIYRPMKYFKGSIPQESINRVNNLQEIVVEKVASKSLGQTINVGEDITYTFRFLNASNTSRTLDVTDVIPNGTTLVSATGWTVSGTNLSCQVTIPAGEKMEISYTVKVGASVPNNKIVSKSAKVGGVSVRSSDIFVANTLTASQQQTLINTVNTLSNSTKTGLELANEIYKAAFGVEKVFEYTTLSSFHSQMYEQKTGDTKYSFIGNRYSDMVAPSLYGGRNFKCEDSSKYGRLVKLAREQHLIVGDIIFGRTSSSNGVYIYLGDGICWNLSTNKADTVSVGTRLERAFGYKNYWAILRPSMNFN